MKRLRRARAQEPELTARPIEAEESEALIVDGRAQTGALFIRGGARRVRPGREEREFDLDEAPIAALFDDPEDDSDG